MEELSLEGQTLLAPQRVVGVETDVAVLVRTLDTVWVNEAFYRQPGDMELYDVADDPAERTNRMTSDADTAARMTKALDAWMVAHGLAPTAGGAAREAAPTAAPREVTDRLRALGYVE